MPTHLRLVSDVPWSWSPRCPIRIRCRRFVFSLRRSTHSFSTVPIQDEMSLKARHNVSEAAFPAGIKPLSNCPGLSEAQQLEFIEMIDTSDLPPNDIHTFEGGWFFLLLNTDTRPGLAKGRRCRALQMRNRTGVFQFGDDEARTLTRNSTYVGRCDAYYSPWHSARMVPCFTRSKCAKVAHRKGSKWSTFLKSLTGCRRCQSHSKRNGGHAAGSFPVVCASSP
jgi:hypothetical protein